MVVAKFDLLEKTAPEKTGSNGDFPQNLIIFVSQCVNKSFDFALNILTCNHLLPRTDPLITPCPHSSILNQFI
jgi:hypothetical protein